MAPNTVQAFPFANDAERQYNWINKGMTLRDYFAAASLQGIMHHDDELSSRYIAKAAYEIADEMLKARE